LIVTRRIAIRIALILLGAVLLQVSFFSFLSVLGATPTVVPVVIVSLGLLGGAVLGAVCGFAAGLLLDSVLLETLGVSSLVLLSLGYLAGRYRESFEVSGLALCALLTGGFTLLGSLAFAAVQLMLGVEAPVSLLVLREILFQALFAIALAFPVYPVVRRILAPALIDYEPSHRVLVPGLRRRRRRGARHGVRAPRRVRGGVA
jgi:rod shape-determining protein MreD